MERFHLLYVSDNRQEYKAATSMRHLLSLITMSYIALFCPAATVASGTGGIGLYLPSTNKLSQQYGLVNDNQFTCPTTSTGQARMRK